MLVPYCFAIENWETKFFDDPNLKADTLYVHSLNWLRSNENQKNYVKAWKMNGTGA